MRKEETINIILCHRSFGLFLFAYRQELWTFLPFGEESLAFSNPQCLTLSISSVVVRVKKQIYIEDVTP